jgi:hypothetical protein
LTEVDFEDFGDFLSEGFVGVTGENDHVFSGLEKGVPELFGEFE